MLFEQDWIKDEWLSHHLLRSSSWRNTFLLSRIRLYIMYARTRAKTSVEHPLFSLHTAKCQTWGCVFLSSFSASLIFGGAFKQPLYRCFSTHTVVYLFWNVIPCDVECCSISSGTRFHITWNRIPS